MSIAAILWFICKLVLSLFAGILVLAVVLLCIKTGVELRGTDGEFVVDVRYGPLKIPVYPLKKREKPEKPEKKPEQADEQPKKESQFEVTLQKLLELDLVTLLLDILSDFVGKLEIKQLRVRLIVGSEDAAKTGMLYGGLAAALGIVQPFLQNHFRIREEQITLEADFDADNTKWAAHLYVVVRPIVCVWILWKYKKQLFIIYRTLKKKDEATEHE